MLKQSSSTIRTLEHSQALVFLLIVWLAFFEGDSRDLLSFIIYKWKYDNERMVIQMQVIVPLDFVIQSCINLALTHIFSFSFIRFFSKRDRYLMRNYFRMRYVSKSLLGCNDKGECGAKPRCRLDFNLLIMFGPSSFTRAFEIESPSPSLCYLYAFLFPRSAFANALNNFWFSSLTPIPISLTEINPEVFSNNLLALIMIWPWNVNFKALFGKFIIICDMRSWSV